MRKAYMITVSVFLIFFTLFLLVNYYYTWNARVEGHIAETKHLDKAPYIFDDVQYSMRGAMETQLEFDSSPGVFTVRFDDFIPATNDIQATLNSYESSLEGDYANQNNVDIDFDQTRFFSDPHIQFTNGLVYNYTNLNKTGVFFHGGGPHTSGVSIKILTDKRWNYTTSNWDWNSSGNINVSFDIRDSSDQQLTVNGSTQGKVSGYENNTVVFNFVKEGTQVPALRIRIGRVDGEEGSVKIERIRLVSFESDLTVNTTSYGPVRAQLPATLNVSSELLSVHGPIILEEL